jgi:hypothetical protein
MGIPTPTTNYDQRLKSKTIQSPTPALRGKVCQTLILPEISVLGAITSIAMAVGDAIMKEEIDKNKKVFIVADEVRTDSPDHLSSFKQWLEGFANELRNINGEIIEKKWRSSPDLLSCLQVFILIFIPFRRIIKKIKTLEGL